MREVTTIGRGTCGRGGLYGAVVGVSIAAIGASLLGCGGAGQKDAAGEIRELTRMVGSSDPEICQHMTDSFLRKVYDGGEAKCVSNVASDAGPSRLGRARVAVSGTRANATAEIRGSTARLRLGFTKTSGSWQLAAMTADNTTPNRGMGIEIRNSTPREAALGYVRAVEAQSQPALCGLLSARRVAAVMGGKASSARDRCHKASFNWDGAQARIAGRRVERVVLSRSHAVVKLSDDGRVTVVRAGFSWFVDDVQFTKTDTR